MPADIPSPLPADPGQAPGALVLRDSRELQMVPPERDRAPLAPAVMTSVVPSALAVAGAGQVQIQAGWPAALASSRSTLAAPPPEMTWALASFALAAGVGWVYERRRRRLLERDPDSAMGPTVRKPPGLKTSPPSLDDTFADSSEVAEAGPSIHVFAIGETTSRREATLVDLHQLLVNLNRLRGKRKLREAAQLLEAHLVDFRYSSPWIFLELRELYRELERPEEWELAREAFRIRFGQNAPQWTAPSTAADEIANDDQLSRELTRKWPRRETRMFILRWMLGDTLTRQKSFGPPQLTLGIYRDMMLLDAVLDEATLARTAELAATA